MEFIEIFKDIVSNLGVPIACLVVTFKLWQKETEKHDQAENKMTEAINNNTLALNKLVDRMDKND
ncbi:MAG: hypothetical protein J6Y47_06100 [Bacteroidales bacterium]|nr:hypothetical protein [Bacteroidales bacterium]